MESSSNFTFFGRILRIFDHFRSPEVKFSFFKIIFKDLSSICKRPHAKRRRHWEVIRDNRTIGMVIVRTRKRRKVIIPPLTKNRGKPSKMLRFQKFLRRTSSNRLIHRMLSWTFWFLDINILLPPLSLPQRQLSSGRWYSIRYFSILVISGI